jgi:serine/threonine protein kinase
LHRDIKPGNILLDENFNAKLADFGLSRIAHYMNESASDYRSTAVVQTEAVGTREYMDPNCIKNGTVIFTRSTDVYSFGRVLLEIACTGKSRADVWEQYNRNPENMAAVADARLRGNFNVAQMKHVALLGLWCSLLDDHQRPTMQQAMDVLERNAILPKLRV